MPIQQLHTLNDCKEYLFKLYQARNLLKSRLLHYLHHDLYYHDEYEQLKTKQECILDGIGFKEHAANRIELSFGHASEHFLVNKRFRVGDALQTWNVAFTQNEIYLLYQSRVCKISEENGLPYINKTIVNITMNEDGRVTSNPPLKIEEQAQLFEHVVTRIKNSKRPFALCVQRYEEQQQAERAQPTIDHSLDQPAPSRRRSLTI